MSEEDEEQIHCSAMKPLKCKTLGVNLSVECKQHVKTASYCKVCSVHNTSQQKSIAAGWCLCWYVLIGDRIGFWQYVFIGMVSVAAPG